MDLEYTKGTKRLMLIIAVTSIQIKSLNLFRVTNRMNMYNIDVFPWLLHRLKKEVRRVPFCPLLASVEEKSLLVFLENFRWPRYWSQKNVLLSFVIHQLLTMLLLPFRWRAFLYKDISRQIQNVKKYFIYWERISRSFSYVTGL